MSFYSFDRNFVLADHLRNVAADTKEEFGRPWGLIATDRLTNCRSSARVAFTGPVISFVRQRQG
jgi:hypothetical protein